MYLQSPYFTCGTMLGTKGCKMKLNIKCGTRYKILVWIGSLLPDNSGFGTFSWVINVKCQKRGMWKLEDGGEGEGEGRRKVGKRKSEKKRKKGREEERDR